MTDLFGGVRSQSFYLHDLKRHQSATLTDIIIRLGGVRDNIFLSFICTGQSRKLQWFPICKVLLNSESRSVFCFL